MKKMTAILLALAIAVPLSACGGGNAEVSSEPLATITKADDTTVELTQAELEEIFDANELDYNNNYRGCAVTLEGPVKSIQQETKKIFNGINAECAVFEVGTEDSVGTWEFFFTLAGLEDKGIDVSSITPGTNIRVSGELGETFIDTKIESAHDLEILTTE